MRGSWCALWDSGERDLGRSRCVRCEFVGCCKLLGAWVECLQALGRCALRFSSFSSRPLCRDGEVFPQLVGVVVLCRTGSRSSMLFCACFSQSPLCLCVDSLVVVTKGSLHMVSERVQPCDCGSPGFPLQ
jgi:hypothetical protein